MGTRTPLGSTYAAIMDALKAVPREILEDSVMLHLDPHTYDALGQGHIRVNGSLLKVQRLAGYPVGASVLTDGYHLDRLYIAPPSFSAEQAEVYRSLCQDGTDIKRARELARLI